MAEIYKPIKFNENMGIRHNVTFRVFNPDGSFSHEHSGHNQATNSMLLGIAHYLTGDGVLNQGAHMLKHFVPQYISLGTMGLLSQKEDDQGLPLDIGVIKYEPITGRELTEAERFSDYMNQVPGYGADGYDPNANNGRTPSDAYEDQLRMGLGPPFSPLLRAKGPPAVYTPWRKDVMEPWMVVGEKPSIPPVCPVCGCRCCCGCCAVLGTDGTEEWDPNIYDTVRCELISDSFPRAMISYREIVPETHSEIPRTIDVVFSAMISTGALAQFRSPGKDYVFITEAGLWSNRQWKMGADNGLLAGYRIIPPNEENWPMVLKKQSWTGNGWEPVEIDQNTQANRDILKKQVLRVGINQVVMVIWKIQIGSIHDLFTGGKVSESFMP